MKDRISSIAEAVRQTMPRDQIEVAAWIDLYNHRLAQSIVKECAQVAWEHTPEDEALEYGRLIGNQILRHFQMT
jgi:hypothetical protein